MSAILAVAQHANAQLVTGWGYETGIASGTLTEGVPGSFAETGVTANAGPRALFTPIDFSDVGDIVQLTGMAQFPNALGNQQFRAGLFNNNGHALGTLSAGNWMGADPLGWLGYVYQLGGTSGTDRIVGRTGNAVSGATWLANAETYQLGTVASAAQAPANTPYNFSLKLTRTGATSVKTDFLFVGGAVNRSGTFTDNGGASSGVTSYNAVGFLTNNNTGSGTFSNVSVTQPKELRLRVNTTTGAMTIVNTNDVPLDLNYYEIRSTAGSLNFAGWKSIEDLEGTDPVGTGWDEAGGSSANILSETNLFGKTTLSPSTAVPLGKAFNIGGTQDLVFSYGQFNQNTLTSAFIEYVTTGIPGDYNENNIVDDADYAVWRKNVGAAIIPNRGPGVIGNVGQADYDFWKARYGAVFGTGASAGATIGTAAVPEPATMLSFAIGLAIVIGRMRRR